MRRAGCGAQTAIIHASIANGENFKPPATIAAPAVLDEITAARKTIGQPK